MKSVEWPQSTRLIASSWSECHNRVQPTRCNVKKTRKWSTSRKMVSNLHATPYGHGAYDMGVHQVSSEPTPHAASRPGRKAAFPKTEPSTSTSVTDGLLRSSASHRGVAPAVSTDGMVTRAGGGSDWLGPPPRACRGGGSAELTRGRFIECMAVHVSVWPSAAAQLWSSPSSSHRTRTARTDGGWVVSLPPTAVP